GKHAAVCRGGKAVTDRTCPPGSSCDAGHCMPPARATACDRETACDETHDCVLYVVGGALHGFCTAPSGASMFGGCSADAECGTGMCVRAGRGQQCLVLCNPDDGRDGCSGGGRHCQPVGTMTEVLEGMPIASVNACAR